MMDYSLPKSFLIGGREYEIRYDFRSVLDICAALEDPELDLKEKAIVALMIFYPEYDQIPPEHIREAVEKCYWFINGGEESPQKKGPRLVSWEKDVKHIIAPINRVLGREIRVRFGEVGKTAAGDEGIEDELLAQRLQAEEIASGVEDEIGYGGRDGKPVIQKQRKAQNAALRNAGKGMNIV